MELLLCSFIIGEKKERARKRERGKSCMGVHLWTGCFQCVVTSTSSVMFLAITNQRTFVRLFVIQTKVVMNR